MPPARRKRQSNTRRELVSQEILERAAALFAERGFSNTNLQDVAQALDISRTALYHYIGGKDELLETLVRGLTLETEQSLKRIAADKQLDPVEKLAAAVRSMATRIANNPARFRLLLVSEGSLPDYLAAEHEQSRRRVLQHLRAILREGIEAGQFRFVDERVAAFALLGMCNWVAWWYSRERPSAPSPDQVADDLAALGVSSLRVADERAPDGAGGVRHALALIRDDLDYLERSLGDQSKA
jgi:AcrR family transcriptional regulator